jgi:cell division protein YceG involved in septum cleavage
MKKLLYNMAAVIGLALGFGCAGVDSDINHDRLQYPYLATPERARQINEGVHKLLVGMTQEHVLQIMGEPDEKNYMYSDYSNVEDRIPEGYVWVYVVQRERPYGSFIQRREKSVKLRFDLKRILSSIEKTDL